MMEYLYSIYYDGKINMNYSVIVRRKRKNVGAQMRQVIEYHASFVSSVIEYHASFVPPLRNLNRDIEIWNTQMTDGENKR